MFWAQLTANAPIYFLIFARVFALISVAPLVGSAAIPGQARAGFVFLITFLVFPVVELYPIPESVLLYVLLLVGEIFLGLIYGFLIQVVFAVFQTAGQFFSMQMGFSASMVFDPLSQEELPIMGQFFNLGAMMLFLSTDAMQKMFLGGIQFSFRTISVYQIASAQEQWFLHFVTSMGLLFQQALILAFPIMGTLFLVSLSMGLLAKAAPQMNLLMLGFPISIAVALILLIIVMPFLLETFSAIIDNFFDQTAFLMQVRGGNP